VTFARQLHWQALAHNSPQRIERVRRDETFGLLERRRGEEGMPLGMGNIASATGARRRALPLNVVDCNLGEIYPRRAGHTALRLSPYMAARGVSGVGVGVSSIDQDMDMG
jgi:hypothetical protein